MLTTEQLYYITTHIFIPVYLGGLVIATIEVFRVERKKKKDREKQEWKAD